jgi:ElaB/YqjD/DUF883 family membrane-anchored ribosome-binding protein
MAEEGTLGLVRTHEPSEDLSKEELQRRLENTRDSISHTVTEIRETVQHQVQAVKDTLDWKEQFKKRPVAWSAGAAGVGFLVGYCIAATATGDSEVESTGQRFYAAQQAAPPQRVSDEDRGPSWWQKVAESQAYDRVKSEASSIGDTFVNELSNTAKQMILPAVIASIRSFLGSHLPAPTENGSSSTGNQAEGGHLESFAAYQPKLERNQ